MNDTVFYRAEFWALVAVSLGFPLALIADLLRKVTVSRRWLVGSAMLLLLLAGLDVALIGRVQELARLTPGLADDAVFLSESQVALYLLPYIAAGVGINLLSFAITQHLRVRRDGEPH